MDFLKGLYVRAHDALCNALDYYPIHSVVVVFCAGFLSGVVLI